MSSKVVSVGSKAAIKSAADLRSDRIKSHLIKELEEAIEKRLSPLPMQAMFLKRPFCALPLNTLISIGN